MTEAQRLTAKSMPESELFNAIARMLRTCGWLYFHIPATAYRHGVREGFPDLVMVRRGRLIFAELKREGKAASEAQQVWLAELRRHDHAGIMQAHEYGVYVWTPSMWLSGEIEEILR